MQTMVGIRELKANLSRYLDRVKTGREIIAITERGKIVAEIHPVEVDIETRLKQLRDLGLISWNGQKLGPLTKLPENTSGVLISDLLLEDRD